MDAGTSKTYVLGVVVFITLFVLAVSLIVYFLIQIMSPVSGIPAEGTVSITGTIECLPHKGLMPHSADCTYGLLGDGGYYYTLQDTDTASTSPKVGTLPTGMHIRIVGAFKKEEDDTYVSVGTIAVISVTPLGDSISDKSVSDGVISFNIPDDFGLATTPFQILSKYTVPPCAVGFAYCLYYSGDRYQGTNFDSAGLAISIHKDAVNKQVCLIELDDGYSDPSVKIVEHGEYAMSIFHHTDPTDTDHSDTAEQYRLYTQDTCYQFSLFVAQTQQGSGRDLTQSDKIALMERLRAALRSVVLVLSDEKLVLPR